MKADKCAECKWMVVMSFCGGQTVDPSRQMCHYNWKECTKIRPDECKFKAKREAGKGEK